MGRGRQTHLGFVKWKGTFYKWTLIVTGAECGGKDRDYPEEVTATWPSPQLLSRVRLQDHKFQPDLDTLARPCFQIRRLRMSLRARAPRVQSPYQKNRSRRDV